MAQYAIPDFDENVGNWTSETGGDLHEDVDDAGVGAVDDDFIYVEDFGIGEMVELGLSDASIPNDPAQSHFVKVRAKAGIAGSELHVRLLNLGSEVGSAIHALTTAYAWYTITIDAATSESTFSMQEVYDALTIEMTFTADLVLAEDTGHVSDVYFEVPDVVSAENADKIAGRALGSSIGRQVSRGIDEKRST